MTDALAAYAEEAVMSNEARYAGDSRLFVEFFRRPVLSNAKSADAGRPIFDEFDFIRIIVPGNRNSTVERKVGPEDKMRFPKQYERYQQGLSQKHTGTPLSQWPQMTVSTIANLNALNIFSVEQLAELSDDNATQIMGSHQLRRQAAAFIALAKDAAVNNKLMEELNKRDEEINLLKSQMSQLLTSKAQVNVAPKPTK